MAHYDSVYAGPGWGDDGAGVAAILEVARAVRAGPPRRRDLVLIFNEGEEQGLWGARALVDSPLIDELGVVVNVEGRGTAGRSYLFEISGPTGSIARPYAATARAPAGSSLYVAIYRMLPNGTDVSVLRDHGMTAANLAFLDNGHLYHTPLDDRAHLDPRSVQHHAEQVLGLVEGLDRADLGASYGHDVFFDLLGLIVVRWSQVWTLPLVIGTGVALFVLGPLALRRARWWHLPAALGLTVLLAVLPVAVGWGTDVLASQAGLTSRHAPGLATASHGLTGAAVLLGVGALAGDLARESLWCALGLVWVGVSVGLALWLPEGVFMGLLPAWGVLVPLGVRGLTQHPVATGLADAVGVLPLVICIHLALGLPTALGVLAPVVAGGVSLALVGFLPVLPGHTLRQGPGLPGAVVLALLATGLRVGSLAVVGPTPERPDGIMATVEAHDGLLDTHARNLTWPTPGAVPDWGGQGLPTPTVELPAATVQTSPRGPTRIQVFSPPDDAGVSRMGVRLEPAPASLAIEGQAVSGGRVRWLGAAPNGLRVSVPGSEQVQRVLTFVTTTTRPQGLPPLPAGYVPVHDGVQVQRWRQDPVPAPSP